MTDVRHTAGRQGEEYAAQHFERLGYQVLARNHRTRYGELDLVVFDGQTLVFVEVKTRRSHQRDAWESLHQVKQSKVRRMAIVPMTVFSLISGTASVVRHPRRCASALPSGNSSTSAWRSAR